ncbi:phosphosulfolactate synthase [Virgibacillus sp. C22-A2]|uniref:Phosphosulfolactate synthase n=1 Tax=Virgibacillus tibetensis TaxID=3042313 RepID=A0ABU6KL00_9BACI|nr:phosphosulfolactate synthase [Virgibacillus sp. C22-A2]
MMKPELILPAREVKPRDKGLTVLIDNGAPLNLFKDTINSASDYIDFVKFGWGTSLVTTFIQQKIDYLGVHNVEYFFGGTLFEKFLNKDKIDDFYNYCKQFNCNYIEISNGTVALSNTNKARFIRDFATEFTVFSEVGNKDASKSRDQSSAEWIEYIHEDMEAGAKKVITEARESGTGGICQEDGKVRTDIFEQLTDSGISFEQLIFEAPTKAMQTFFIQQVGSNVNLANIPLSDVISLETLRLGLRSDTFYLDV